MKKLLAFCAASALALTASAITKTFTPGDSDLGDLDHHYAYAWGISWDIPAGEQITKVTLSIKNIWDWTQESDALYIRLVDDPYMGTNSSNSFKTFLDNTNDNVKSDYFTESGHNWGGINLLAGRGYVGDYWNDPFGGNNGKNATNLSWDFTASQIQTLTSYLTDPHGNNTADFGITFDPDCHYFNDGITLTITTGKVPDGGTTILLLGLGLLAIAGVRRKITS